MHSAVDNAFRISSCIFWYEDRDGSIALYDLRKKRNYKIVNVVSRQIFNRINKGCTYHEIVISLQKMYENEDPVIIRNHTEKFFSDLKHNGIIEELQLD